MPDLNDIPAALFAFLLFFALQVAIQLGFKAGRKLEFAVWDKLNRAFFSVTGATLALLGLLLAFSFSMAVSRYEARKVVVLMEANAIGTAWLRTDFLQPGPSQTVRQLLRDYVKTRIEYHDSAAETQKSQEFISQAKDIQDRIWAVAAVMGNYREPQQSTHFSALTEAVIAMGSVRNERRYAIENQVPSSVIALLMIITLQAAALTGFAFGANNRRLRLALIGFPLLLSLVIYTILDLDRPTRGWIVVDQVPMLALEASLK
ncbi:MAG: hypothetical protein V4542_19590 [Pseudomonadota bacterium]